MYTKIFKNTVKVPYPYDLCRFNMGQFSYENLTSLKIFDFNMTLVFFWILSGARLYSTY